MFAATHRTATAYAAVSVETGVEAADPHALILMLFDGALLAVGNARRHMIAGATAAKGESISKAIAIIDNGLKASLDMSSGGDLAYKLAGLYEYMCRQLLLANARNSIAELDESRRLLGELRGAWMEIARGGPAAGRGNAP